MNKKTRLLLTTAVFILCYLINWQNQSWLALALSCETTTPKKSWHSVENEVNYFNFRTFQVKASSYLDNQKVYQPENVADGDRTTAWVEGVAGDGIGESLTIILEEPRRVTEIGIVPGYTKSEKIWTVNNRVAEVEIIVNDSFTITQAFIDKYNSLPPTSKEAYQLVSLEGFDEIVKSLRITLTKVYKGTKYEDTCISEILLRERLDDQKTAPPVMPLRLQHLSEIRKVDMAEIEAKLSQPTQIDYITWENNWTPKREELPASIYWDFFDSSKVKHFSPGEIKALADFGFFIERASVSYPMIDDMVDQYKSLADYAWEEYSIVPVYISTDLLLHVYHVLFDRNLQDLEQKKFKLLVEALTYKLYQRSKQDYATAVDDSIKQAAMKNQVYFAVASKLLSTVKTYRAMKDFAGFPGVFKSFKAGDILSEMEVKEFKSIEWRQWGENWSESEYNQIFELYEEKPLGGQLLAEDVKNMTDAEFSLVMAAKGRVKSPWLGSGKKEDYTQYRPRGHYTKNEDLKSYFRAMMWYGRMRFDAKDPLATLQAILITRALQDPELANLWSAIMNPIEFLIGEQEGLGVPDYRQLISEIYGENPSLEDFADSNKLALFRKKAERLPKNYIFETKSFRLLGQRFIPDAHIFTKLTYPRVGSLTNPRTMPKAIDVMAVLGSTFAETMLADEKTNIPGYADSFKVLQTDYQKTPQQKWQSSTYWCWLNTLKSLLVKKDERFPFFMRSLNWQKKSLLTSLSSWGELKHDTFLYTAQSLAELGEGGPEVPPPPPPKGYIVPDLEFFNRLIYMAEKMYWTLDAVDLFSDEYRQKIAGFLSELKSLRRIVIKELLNQSIGDDEYEAITSLYKRLETIITPLYGELDDRSKRMAIVSDVHTDAQNGQVLTIGVGTPQRIYVAVKDKSGGVRVTVGYIFSYYEFPQPIDRRMTDEEWQDWVYYDEKDLSDKEPAWIRELRLQTQK